MVFHEDKLLNKIWEQSSVNIESENTIFIEKMNSRWVPPKEFKSWEFPESLEK